MDGWIWASPVADERTLYVGTLAGTLVALDLDRGTERWSLLLEGPILGPPVFVEDQMAVVTDEKILYVLDPRRGQERGSCSLDESVRTPIVAKGRMVYMVDVENNVLAVNTRSVSGRCSFLWSVLDGEE